MPTGNGSGHLKTECKNVNLFSSGPKDKEVA